MTDKQMYTFWWLYFINLIPGVTSPFLSRIFLSLHFKSEKGREDVWECGKKFSEFPGVLKVH